LSDLGDLFQRAADLLGSCKSTISFGGLEEPESIELAQTEFVGSSGVTVNIYGTADPATIAREIENALRPPLKFGSPLIGCECDACA
jgi:hypothetical protein